MPSSGAPSAPPQHTIPRRRLAALFRRASRCRVTLCVAPAGYGKTTALAQFLGRNAPDTAFVTLSERGTGLFSVVREIALALSNLLDRPELTLSAVYDRVSVSTTPEIDLARWLQAHLPERPVTIVVENLGAAAADPQVVRFLDRLVREAASLRWYLVARNAGSLPLPNWMADGLLDLPIDHHALAFTPGDTAALARRYSPMTPAQAGALTARMHGWPLGIAMRLRYGDRFAELAYDRRNTAGAYRALIDACYRACSARSSGATAPRRCAACARAFRIFSPAGAEQLPTTTFARRTWWNGCATAVPRRSPPQSDVAAARWRKRAVPSRPSRCTCRSARAAISSRCWNARAFHSWTPGVPKRSR